MNSIEFAVNNGAELIMSQEIYDGKVKINRLCAGCGDYEFDIPAGDMVMLLNLYKHIKDNDIQNDFINPNGSFEG